MRVDASEVNRLAADLGRVSGRTIPLVEAVMKRAAQNIKDEMVEDAKGSRHFRSVAPTISYDRVAGVTGIGYEIGPDRQRGGGAGLAGAYFGWNHGGGTLDIDGPLNREAPNLDRHLGDVLGGLL